LGCIWLSAQVVYVMSLLYSSMGKNTAVSSSSSAFSFVFSILLLGYEFRIISALGVVGTIGGVVMTSLFRPDEIIDPTTSIASSDDFEIVDTAQGYIMAVSAAACFGLFSCLFKKWIQDDKYGGVVFGTFGLISLVLGIPLVIVCHFTGLQPLSTPCWQAALLITADAILCCFVNNFCLSRAFIYLTPVVVLVGLSMTTPLSIFVDVAILGKTAYSAPNIVGICLIILAVLVVGYDQNIYEKKLEKSAMNAPQPNKEDTSAAVTDSGIFSGQ
jgi:solute carrier family 35 protein F5